MRRSALTQYSAWHIGYLSTYLKLAFLILAACAAFAADVGKDIQESCFLAIHFANGNTASIHLTNGESKEQVVNVERYSSIGALLDNVKKTVPAGGNAEVRLVPTCINRS